MSEVMLILSIGALALIAYIIWEHFDMRRFEREMERDRAANARTYAQRMAMINGWSGHTHEASLPLQNEFHAVTYDEHLETLKAGLDPLALYPLNQANLNKQKVG